MSYRPVVLLGAVGVAAVGLTSIALASQNQAPGIDTSRITASHVVQISESPPRLTDCDDESDLGRIVIHSAGDSGAIFFCAQGKKPNYMKPRWFKTSGTPVR